MKQRNLWVALIFVACIANAAPSKADDAQGAATEPTVSGTANDEAVDAAKLEEINALLRQLAATKALELDENGNIRVKQSVTQQLRDKGRINAMGAGYGSVCN